MYYATNIGGKRLILAAVPTIFDIPNPPAHVALTLDLLFSTDSSTRAFWYAVLNWRAVGLSFQQPLLRMIEKKFLMQSWLNLEVHTKLKPSDSSSLVKDRMLSIVTDNPQWLAIFVWLLAPANLQLCIQVFCCSMCCMLSLDIVSAHRAGLSAYNFLEFMMSNSWSILSTNSAVWPTFLWDEVDQRWCEFSFHEMDVVCMVYMACHVRNQATSMQQC